MAISLKKRNFVEYLSSKGTYTSNLIQKNNKNNNVMQTQNEYTAPEVKFVEVIVEEGILISGIVINDRFENEKHIVDEVEGW